MSLQLKIGAVARLAEVSVDSVRYYERRGLLPTPDRRESGYRIFSEKTVERIRFVKQLQTLGFSLDEVADVLKMLDAGTATCENQQPRMAAVLARVDAEIAQLQTTRRRIADVLQTCQIGGCTWSGCGSA
ncbi:MAG: MerR family transcriptional regulator [Nannocystaceae bacterium]|nr:MerR family transcriptional regulator [Nannocystaceae bacterium]